MKLKYLPIALLISSTACALSPQNPGTTGTASGSGTTEGGATSGTTNGNPPVDSGKAGNGPTVRYIGRVDSTTPILSWPGSAVQTVFNGTKGTVAFTSKGAGNYVQVAVDDNAPTVTKVTNGVAIPFGPVAQGVHTVTVTKITEATYGSLQLAGFNTDGTGQNTTVPQRRIEFIGDSITAGYGVLGTSPCTNTSALESAANTYAYLTASALKADASLIAWSGKGVVRNVVSATNSDTVTMSQLWLQTAANDNSPTYTFPADSVPQAVVVNLGTNDFSYLAYDSSGSSYQGRAALDENSYVTAVVSLVQNVMAKYPGVQVVLCSSPMLSDSYPSASDAQHSTQLSYLKSAATQIGGSNIHVLDFPTQQTGAGLNGCDAHPSKTQHETMAAALTAELKTDLGW
jgi:lysophospholipase L1-like esterase